MKIILIILFICNNLVLIAQPKGVITFDSCYLKMEACFENIDIQVYNNKDFNSEGSIPVRWRSLPNDIKNYIKKYSKEKRTLVLNFTSFIIDGRKIGEFEGKEYSYFLYSMVFHGQNTNVKFDSGNIYINDKEYEVDSNELTSSITPIIDEIGNTNTKVDLWYTLKSKYKEETSKIVIHSIRPKERTIYVDSNMKENVIFLKSGFTGKLYYTQTINFSKEKSKKSNEKSYEVPSNLTYELVVEKIDSSGISGYTIAKHPNFPEDSVKRNFSGIYENGYYYLVENKIISSSFKKPPFEAKRIKLWIHTNASTQEKSVCGGWHDKNEKNGSYTSAFEFKSLSDK